MKKILLVNNGYPSETNKHYVSYIKSIKECLEAADFDVTLLVMSSDFNSKIQKIKCYLFYYWNLLTFGKYDDYDYVYINNYPHSFFPLIFHFNKMNKVIIHWHGDDIENNGIMKRKFNKFSYNFIPKKSINFSPSKYFSIQISDKLRINTNTIFVTPSGGVDVELFRPLKMSDNEENKVKIGFSSHLSADKGVDLIIEFLKNISMLNFDRDVNFELHYIKYGFEKEKYSKILSSFPNTIEHPIAKKEDMPKFYNNIDLFLFPTKRDSLGSVGLEALACGVPVLGTDDFAIKEYVLPGINGELFKKDDYQSFEKNLITCINNLGRYNPRETVLKEYSKEAVVKKYKEFLG
jgi:glycosyltransferase involved in cell wall biosynthesis